MVVFEDKDDDNEIDIGDTEEPNEIIERFMYYAFGMQWEGAWLYDEPVDSEENRYRYNGKEYSKGSRLSDYGARYYSPDIGRWAQVDPLAEAMSSWSPYNYGFNAPIYFIDPTGMAPEDNNYPDPTNDRPFGEANYDSTPTFDLPQVTITAPRSENNSSKTNNNVNWKKINDGLVITLGGGLSVGAGVGAMMTGAGVPAGVAGITLGVPAIGFGVANIIDGFQNKNRVIPGGLFEGIDKGVGGNGSVGQITDVFATGLPKDALTGFVFGFGIYNSNIGQILINSPSSRFNDAILDNKYEKRDNTTVVIPKID